MKNKIQELLLPFYFGSIDDENRLAVERELLIDSETLVDYLDLKRKLESASQIPEGPSPNLWRQLDSRLKPHKKIIYSLSLGLAVAASLAILMFLFKNQPIETTPSQLFDSARELPANSNVL